MPTSNNRAESVKSIFDTNGSQLAVPVSPNANPLTDPSINVQGNSLLHNQYSNIGDPNLTTPAYNNMGAAAMGYTNPNTSALGLRTQLYQEPSSRYKQNAPEGRTF